MQSSNTPLSSRTPDPLSSNMLQNTQSPTRSSPSSSHSQTPLASRPSFASSLSRETMSTSSSSLLQSAKPSTPTSNSLHVMQDTPPLTPPNSLSPASSSSISIASTMSLGSTLTAGAPQFQARLLDAPIDIRSLTLSDSAGSISQNTSETLPKARTVTDPLSHAPADVLSISMGAALLNEGPTPTQESFALKHSLSIGLSSHPQTFPTVTSQGVASPSPSNDPGDMQTSRLEAERTPNVYINGLPPNFPEERLFEMTRDFGEVISVRTFTRHVSDKPSGYGFVLFGNVDAAERCIEALRKYRNLHPSFSKRVHKIPGTVYGSAASSTSDDGISLSSFSGQGSTDLPSDSFKARMERLQDRASTNLYMEGLPLDVDEPTLAALVSPYRIMSSRFFQTRLSNPPRIIAFVRLETRPAAEEIIERLHGRMVRGWRDPGCRISVRFADTSEQRELRRMERTNNEGENSPARLTIAQAALLNLKGTQLQGAVSPLNSSKFSGVSPTLNTNLSLFPDILHSNNPLGVHPTHLDRYGSEFINPALHGLGVGHVSSQYNGLNAQAAEFTSRNQLRMPQNPVLDFNRDNSDLHSQLQALSIRSNTASRAQDGFTTVERLLLQAHLQHQQEQLAAASAQLDSLRAQASPGLGNNATLTLNSPPLTLGPGTPLTNFMTSMSEEEFHAGSAHHQQKPFGEVRSAAVEIRVPPSRRALDLPDARANFTRQRNQTHAESRANADVQKPQSQTVHARSTTLPSQYSSSDRSSGTRFLSSVSSEGNSLKSVDVKSSFDSKKNIIYSYSSSKSNNRPFPGNSMNNDSTHRDNNSHTPQPVLGSTTSITTTANNQNDTKSSTHTRLDTTSSGLLAAPARTTPSTSPREQDSSNESGSESSSPALSYSTRTPATLSPATPFSAFCETFDGPAPEVMVPTVSVNDGSAPKEVGLGIGAGATKDKVTMA